MKKPSFILSDNVYYRYLNDPGRWDKEISIVGPAIWSLALTGFEQQELIELRLKDLDILHNTFRVRNLYKYSNELLSEWIVLDDITKSRVMRYLEYRSELDFQYDNLLLLNGEPLNNRSINDTFAVFKRVGNHDKFRGGGSVSARTLVRSGLVHTLNRTKGKNLMDIIAIFGMDNAQVQFAVEAYLANNTALAHYKKH